MKKKDLKNFEELKKNRMFSKEAEDNVKSIIIGNFAVCVSIIILILTYIINATLLEQNLAILVYNVSAMAFLAFNIIVFEIAYKKDSARIGLCGVEILVISIFTLFSPYIFLKFKYEIFCYSLIVIATLYYLCKIILTYKSEKNKYLLEISDIKEIVKKESKDKRAAEETEKNIENEKKAREEAKRELLNNAVDKEKEIKETETKKSNKTKTNKDESDIKPKAKTKSTTRTRKTTTKTTTKKSTTTKTRKKVEPVEEQNVDEKVEPIKKKTTTRKKATTTKENENTLEEKKPTTKRTTTTRRKKVEPVETLNIDEKGELAIEKNVTTKPKKATETKPKKTTTKRTTAKTTTTRKRTTTKKTTTKKGE